MIFAILTLLTALALAGVAGWFSIVGFMAIYAGAPMYALIMGVVTECAKLVTTSWLYRNWEYADWKLKAPLLYFTAALMVATSIGVFGFLSKAHLEQTAGTLDNSAKIETLNYQINREKAIIADNEKVISQLDATVNSFLGKDRTDKSLAVRRAQAPQRKQLRDDSDAAQKRIDALSNEKFALESEVRKLQLEVGPIRYIAEVIYGTGGNSSNNIEAAVRIFTLLIVSTLDPLAVVLLIAANHTLLRLRNEKEKKVREAGSDRQFRYEHVQSDEQKSTKEDSRSKEAPSSDVSANVENVEILPEVPEIREPLLQESQEVINEIKEDTLAPAGSDSDSIQTAIQVPENAFKTSPPREIDESNFQQWPEIQVDESIKTALEEFLPARESAPLPVIRQPSLTRVSRFSYKEEAAPAEELPALIDSQIKTPWAQQDRILQELLGDTQHFTPKKLNEKEQQEKATLGSLSEGPRPDITEAGFQEAEEIPTEGPRESATPHGTTEEEGPVVADSNIAKGPLTLSWLKEFRR